MYLLSSTYKLGVYIYSGYSNSSDKVDSADNDTCLSGICPIKDIPLSKEKTDVDVNKVERSKAEAEAEINEKNVEERNKKENEEKKKGDEEKVRVRIRVRIKVRIITPYLTSIPNLYP
jgi:hypothetical protein